MSLNRINEKLNAKQRKISWSVQNTLTNRNSLLFCTKCHKRLGLITMVHFALGKKKGEKYMVVCKHCNHINKRIKGDMAKKIDDDWSKYGV